MIVVATVYGVVAVVQNVCMAETVHVRVFDVQAAVVYAAVAFGVEFVVTFVVVIVVAVTVELVEFVAASGAEAFAVFVVVAAVFVVALGVLAVVEISVFVVGVVVIVVALVVVAVVVAFVVKVACMASGDSTWVGGPSIVESMGLALA